jgi:hypothetical protein
MPDDVVPYTVTTLADIREMTEDVISALEPVVSASPEEEEESQPETRDER